MHPFFFARALYCTISGFNRGMAFALKSVVERHVEVPVVDVQIRAVDHTGQPLSLMLK